MHYLILDVESIGMYGEPFAVGIVILNSEGVRKEEHLFACDPEIAKGREYNRMWVREYVPLMEYNCQSVQEVRQRFWEVWERWINGTIVLADVAFPVETRFLSLCVMDATKEREYNAPYPLHEIASLALAADREPLADWLREPDEEPMHNPLCDARHSARKVIEYLNLRGLEIAEDED